MRCIHLALLLLRAYAAATTSPSASRTTHSPSDTTIVHAAQDSKTTSDSTSVVDSTSGTVNTAKAPSASSSTTVTSPLVFLPQASESLCPSRTVNYITHSLPQQCLRASRFAPGNTTLPGVVSGNGTTITSSLAETQVSEERDVDKSGNGSAQEHVEDKTSIVAQDSAEVRDKASKTDAAEEASPLGIEDEHDSPLDKSNFLSFEEWKKQNLEKAGQSPDNVGQGRPQGGEGRRRPINNALDTLGEEGEIELDFGGFGDGSSRYTPGTESEATKTADTTGSAESAHASPAKHRSKDAGKTCKERFNYASFDCAATVLKTNQKCKSSSSVLVENKDSYMLNECSADNKFIIIELCDDILVDTVVVANFEFFSSMFRTFRVSVSDRYPVKADRWKDLGTFEARNTRDIQAFLVENPLIWARYLRIEFLTHYGSEFYCPVSLVRVHGTTMMEEFRHQEDVARGDEDDEVELIPDVEPVAPVSIEIKTSDTPTIPSEPAVVEKSTESHEIAETPATETSLPRDVPQNATLDSTVHPIVGMNTTRDEQESTSSGSSMATSEARHDCPAPSSNPNESTAATSSKKGHSSTVTSSEASSNVPRAPPSPASTGSLQSESANRIEANSSTSSTSLSTSRASNSSSTEVTNKPTTTSTAASVKNSEVKSSSGASSAGSPASSKSSTSETTKQPSPPPPPQPTTQDSFFKQTNKRLNMLETNSSLNIQYIEEQSRILRDAFVQTEKRQLAKTENFLKHLNETVIAELKGFRTQYDQLWQSTVIELEESRARSQKEMMAFSSRLTVLADELVWAKRMNVVQSILLLASLGLFVFASKGKDYMDMPIMQQALKRSQSVLRLGGHGSFDSPSPPGSPESMRASSPEFRRSLRKMNRLSSPEDHERQGTPDHDRDAELSSPIVERTNRAEHDSVPMTPTGKLGDNPGIHFEPPTPEASIDGHSIRGRSASPILSPEEAAKAVARGAQSGPATPSGTRENQPLTWADGANGDVSIEKSPVLDGEALSSSLLLTRERALTSSSARSGSSPLRNSIVEESEDDESGQDEQEVVPSIETDDLIEAGVDLDDDDDAGQPLQEPDQPSAESPSPMAARQVVNGEHG